MIDLSSTTPATVIDECGHRTAQERPDNRKR
jgi:hypothetical protein